jgi:hypothetical protein
MPLPASSTTLVSVSMGHKCFLPSFFSSHYDSLLFILVWLSVIQIFTWVVWLIWVHPKYTSTLCWNFQPSKYFKIFKIEFCLESTLFSIVFLSNMHFHWCHWCGVHSYHWMWTNLIRAYHI